MGLILLVVHIEWVAIWYVFIFNICLVCGVGWRMDELNGDVNCGKRNYLYWD